jgi:UDP-N-acetylglucosamine transferase subunit ALG13
MPLQFGKIPVVMPRQFKFGEHVNDHQLTFCQEVANQQHNIILVENDEELKTAIIEYKDISAKMQNSITSNNKVFNEDLEKMVQSLFPKK